MGVVYRAEDSVSGQRVALKTVRGATAPTLASIRREIVAMSQAHHRGIVRITDHGVADGLPWYAMELLEGFTLRDHIYGRFSSTLTKRSAVSNLTTQQDSAVLRAAARDGSRLRGSDSAPAWNDAPPIKAILDVFHGICGPLTALHSQGIVHRDLKPENVFVEHGRVVLVDFGIAVRFGDSREYEIGEYGLAGTPEYVAPEQILGRNIDARADLYSIGCMLYESLTGRPPFVGDSVGEIVAMQLSTAPRPPSELVDGVPPALDRLVLRLLAKRSTDRPGYADDLASTLLALGAQATPEVETKTRAYVYRPEFVGRTELMGRLDAIVHGDVTTGRRVIVRGESGIGKTRLLRELAANAAAKRFAVVVAQCAGIGPSPDGAAASFIAPLQPFRAFLQKVSDLCRERGPAETRRLLGQRAHVLATIEPSLLDRLDLSAPEPAPAPSPFPDVARARLFSSLRDTLFAYANDQPMLIVVDDLQWSDELTIGFLASLDPAVLAAHRTSIVCTSRSEEVHDHLAPLEAAPGVSALSLDGLSPADVGDMLRGMLALDVAPPAFTDFLIHQSEGNPFFVAEYLRAAIDHGLLQRDSAGGWQLRINDGKEDLAAAFLPMPPTIRELMSRRIANLEPHVYALLESAAVLGREFDGDLLHAASGLDDVPALQTLRRRQILEEGNDGRLRFVHDRVRDTAYRLIAPERRIDLHRRAAEAMESIYDARADRGSALPALALHWSRSGVHARAAACYVLLGDRGRDGYAHGEALESYELAAKALRIVISSPTADRAVWQNALRQVEERRADVLTIRGNHERARLCLTAAIDGLSSQQHPVWIARLLWKFARTLETEHRHLEALAIYDRAESALGTAPPPSQAPPAMPEQWPLEAPDESQASWWHQWVQLQVERVWVHYWLADVDAMAMRVERVRSLVETRGTPAQRARFFQALTHANIRRERYAVSDQTVSFARASLDAADLTGDAGMVAYAQFVLSFQLLFSGDLRVAGQAMRAALTGAERTGDLALQARCLTYLTVQSRLTGDLTLAQEHALRSLEVAGQLGMDDYLGAAHANLGWIAWRQRDAQAAERETRQALEHWRKLATRYPYPFQWLARLHAMASTLEGDSLAEAVDHARTILEAVQHRLPDELSEPLEQALKAWERGDAASTGNHLRAGLEGARALKYV